MNSHRDFTNHRTRKPEQDTAAARSTRQTQEPDLVELQRQIGNQAVQRLMAQGRLDLAGSTLQAKLTVGEPDDQYEQEADAVAQEVMMMRDEDVQRQAFEDEEDFLQTKPISSLQRDSGVEEEVPQVTNDTESTIEGMRGGGQSMPDDTRNFMESRFGQDFSNVNIHTGSDSDTLNRDLNARAFTTGSDIFFGQGEYSPNSSEGKNLLAHELTHVVQQGASSQLQPQEDEQVQRSVDEHNTNKKRSGK